MSVSDLRFGATPNSLVAVPDVSQCWLEEQQIIYPYGQASFMTSQGPLGYGFPSTPGGRVYVRYTYINGYANSILDANASAGDSAVVVDDPTGIVPGEWMTIFDGANTERVEVSDSYSIGSTTVTLNSPLLFAHVTGVGISSLPAAIKEAAIVMTSAFLKIRGDASLTMGVTTRPGGQNTANDMMGNEKQIASEILKPFRRIR